MTMTPESLAFLKSLLDTPGPSAFEAAPARVWRAEAQRFADDVRADVAGNSFATLNGQGRPRVMFAGHIDEIGIMVTHLDDDGYVSFDTIGGWDHQVFVGQRVRLLGRQGDVVGVVGKKAIHLMDKDDREKVSKVEDLWIDIGATSRAEAERQLRIGDPGVLAAGVLEFPNGRLVSRCIDNRIGAFVVLEALRLLSGDAKRTGAAVTAVATTREEIAAMGGGARSSAAALEPDVAIVIDVTHATDYPGIDKRKHGDYRLGGGPVLSRGASVSELVFERLAAAAQAEEHSLRHRGRGPRHPYRCGGHLQRAPRRGDGARLGAQPVHAQPQRDDRAGGPRPHRPSARRLRAPSPPRHRLRAALSAAGYSSNVCPHAARSPASPPCSHSPRPASAPSRWGPPPTRWCARCRPRCCRWMTSAS
jgi:Cellulase M and related proteins